MAAASKKFPYIIPRSFRLRQELEFAEKGFNAMEQKTSANAKPKDANQEFISYGLGDLDDSSYELQLANWQATIIGPQNTPLGDRIYNLRVRCGARFPEVPPVMHFVQKINMPGVDATTGMVTGLLKTWTRETTINDYLIVIRNAMAQTAAKLKQPAAEDLYPVPNYASLGY